MRRPSFLSYVPLRPFFFLGSMLLVACVLRVASWINGPRVPQSNIPAVSWDDVQYVEKVRDVLEPVADTAAHQQPMAVPLPVEEDVLPDAMNLAVPFVSQAPLGIWDSFTEETCEEASFSMVQAYYAGKAEGSFDSHTADADFRAMVALEESLHMGPSISAQELVEFARAYAGIALRIIDAPSVDDLRALLASGHPILVPAFGRTLGNPFFTGEGPLYHMLVLRGYTAKTFIVNDPGTRHGENYQYDIDVIMRSIGDWDGDSPHGGAKVLIFDR